MRLKKLINILSDKEILARTEAARANHRCKICGNQASSFSTTQAELEYRLSSICQACQDYYIESL